MKSQSIKYILMVIQLVLYGSFIRLDIFGLNIALSNRFKFTLVVLCFLHVLISRYRNRSREHSYLIYALLFTVVSDIFILLSEYYFYGVLTFILVQQLHGIRITELYNREISVDKQTNSYREVPARLLFQVTLAMSVGFILWMININIDALLVASVFYFISLCTNVVRSLRLSLSYPKRRDIKYYAIGLVLFLLCDISVGLFNLSDFLPLSHNYQIIYNISSILMWVFYAPSQVLISLSGYKR